VFTADGVMEDDANNFVAWGKMYKMMMDRYATSDGKLSSAIENYLLTACRVPAENINAFKNIILK
jgi:hypothetical protein